MAEPAAKRVELIILDGGRSGHGGGPPGGGGGGIDERRNPLYGTEDHLAERLVEIMGEDWRCAAGQWHCWDGARWQREQTKLAWDTSRQVCRTVAMSLEGEAKSRAEKVSSAQAVYAAVRLAEADRRVAMAMSEFDRDRELLNTPDGIVDLRSGQLMPHERDKLMTKLAAAGPMSAGDCPHFKRYLNEATGGDEALQRYLQRVAGYCLTGSIEEHCILFFYGPGGSGKTTFLLVIQDLLGDYAVNAPMNAFTVSTGERHPTELAHFFGARVVAASEVEEGMRWDEGKLKAISGGDRITARYMRGDFFTFEPQFKLLLAGNHRPRMRSADDAMRRRMQVIPFRCKPSKADKQLREKLQSELGAILRWAVEGEAERRRLGGLFPPRVVVQATDEYFQSENTIGRWIDERCELPDEGVGSATDAIDPVGYWGETRALYRDFADWAKRVGEYVISERIFSQKLEQMPRVTKALHPRTRRSGFAGLRLHFAEMELPLDAPHTQTRAGRRQDGAGSGTELPFDPADDEAEQWPRD